jgi:2'-5' RNA ligase
MRVFIAVDIDEDVRKNIAALQRELRQKARADEKSVKWVNPDKMHLTLKFLGEVKDADITDVCKAAEQVAQGHDAFDLDIETVGHFGGTSARVLWVGTTDGGEQLAQLANELDEQLWAIGFAKETRRFTGHLTLCRIKNHKAGVELAALADNYGPFEAGASLVDSIVVYQSELTKTGPIYTALGTYKLQQ